MNLLIVALMLAMVGGFGGALLCAQVASSKSMAGQEIITGVAPLSTDHVSVFLAQTKQTIRYSLAYPGKIDWRNMGGSLLAMDLGGVVNHPGDRQIARFVGRGPRDPFDHLLQPDQRLPVRVRVENGQAQSVEVFPPVLYFCRVDQVDAQNRAIQITRDRDSGDWLGGVAPWPDEVETLKVWLPLAEKVVAHRNFAEATWSDLASQSRVMVWLNTKGEVFHLDAFEFDTTCWRTTVDPEKRILSELKDKGWESYELVRTIPLAEDVRIWKAEGREIDLANFPKNIYEVPLHALVQLDQTSGEAKCIIVFYPSE